MPHKSIIAAAIGAYILFLFAAIRVAIPALMNMRNDGGIALAIILVISLMASPFFIYEKFIKEEDNEVS